MRARAHIPLTQNPVFFFSMRARSLSTQFSPYQVSTWRPETALPPTAASQPVLSSWPQPASLRISLLLSSNHIDPLSTSPRIICSGLRSLPQGLCTCSFFFWTSNPLSPHLGQSDIFLTDQVSTWKSSTVRTLKVKIIPGLRKYNSDCNRPRWGQQQDQQKSVFLTGPRCTCKTTNTPYF